MGRRIGAEVQTQRRLSENGAIAIWEKKVEAHGWAKHADSSTIIGSKRIQRQETLGSGDGSREWNFEQGKTPF